MCICDISILAITKMEDSYLQCKSRQENEPAYLCYLYSRYKSNESFDVYAKHATNAVTV